MEFARLDKVQSVAASLTNIVHYLIEEEALWVEHSTHILHQVVRHCRQKGDLEHELLPICLRLLLLKVKDLGKVLPFQVQRHASLSAHQIKRESIVFCFEALLTDAHALLKRLEGPFTIIGDAGLTAAPHICDLVYSVDLAIDKHDYLLADCASLANNFAWFVDVEAETLDEHFDRRLFDVVKYLILVLQVQDEKFVLLGCPVERILQHQIPNVDQFLFEVVVEELLVFLLLRRLIDHLNLILVLILISKSVLFFQCIFLLFLKNSLDTRLVIVKVHMLGLCVCPGGVLDLVLLNRRHLCLAIHASLV